MNSKVTPTIASQDARPVSRWAATISSVSSTGIPVRPNSRSGKRARRLQGGAHARQVVLDRADLVEREEQQGPVAQGAEVNPVKQAVEQLGVPPDFAGQGVEGGPHPGRVGAADDGDQVVLVAELGQ